MRMCFTFSRLAMLALVFSLNGCIMCPPNMFGGAYRNVSEGKPHAILHGTDHAPEDVYPTGINGQLTSFWRSNNTFRIPPGSTELSFYGLHMRFKAVLNCEYNLGYAYHSKGDITATPSSSYLGSTSPEPDKTWWSIADSRYTILLTEHCPGRGSKAVAETTRQFRTVSADSKQSALAKDLNGQKSGVHP
jgi:hypothetical protein